jgi:hypothetical protein
MRIENEFNIGDIVYLKTDEQQRQRIITGILIRDNRVGYYVSYIDHETHHFEIEMSKDPNNGTHPLYNRYSNEDGTAWYVSEDGKTYPSKQEYRNEIIKQLLDEK